ncbi:MAG: hypothetical protein EA378_09275 [Phycisphaerales bacterium]|nr:MAG: hypothetical protein EA378_09275 [Phycisphaerales bacterium]
MTRAIESNHLPSTLYFLPGPSGLRELVKAAKKTGADEAAVERSLGRIGDYEAFLRLENISRDALHAMVGDLAPEARASVVRTNAQSVHKSMSNLIGYSAEVMLTALILFPSPTPGRCELAQVSGFDGLQRHRTGAWFMTSGYGRTAGGAPLARTLDGVPTEGRGPSTLLSEYCSHPTPSFEASHSGRRHVHRLVEHEVALRSSCTFFFGERIADAYADPAEEVPGAGRLAMISSVIATPAKHLHFDVLVHRDVWRGADVRMETFRTVPHGPVDEQAIEERAPDRIELGARVQRGEHADAALPAPRLRRYGAMMREAMARLGLAPDDFRIYRCEVVYPLYGTQYAMCFRMP